MNSEKLAYQIIEEEILDRIKSGIYKSGDQLPTERMLAEEFDTSRITISKGLANLTASGYITRTRGRGTFVADKQPNKKKLGKGFIKYISPGLSGEPVPISNGIMQGLYDVISAEEYHVGVDFYQTDDEQELQLGKYTSPLNNGFVIWPALTDNLQNMLEIMKKNNFPFVLVDAFPDKFECDYVINDNTAGASIMIDYLAKCGHERIAYFSATPNRISLTDRLSGVMSGFARNNLEFSGDSIIMIPEKSKIITSYLSATNTKFIRTKLEKLMSSKNPPTAIFASNDWIAMSIYRELEDMKIRVPDEVSIAGFDNIDAARYFNIPLTTIAQDFFAIGKAAGQILLDKMNSNNGSFNQQIRILPNLIERESVSKLNQ